MRAPAEFCYGTNGPREFQCARLDSRRQSKGRPGKSSRKCTWENDSALPNCDDRPVPREERAGGPQGCLPSSRSWVARALRIRRALKCTLSVGTEANNGTRGQQHGFFVGKPCSLNTIGGVTGTQRSSESRTKEQASDGRLQSCGSAKTFRITRGIS